MSLLSAAAAASAATHAVDSLSALQARINDAAPGDIITLKNGVYTTAEPIVVTRGGEPGKPITIAAESVGGVEIGGTHGFNVAKPAAHVVISGFKFTHASGRNTIGAGTSHVRFTRNTFQCVGDGPYLSVIGDDAEVDHNEFRDKKTVGNMISVSGVSGQVARQLHIHRNYFHDFTNAGANGAETIRFGLSGLSMSMGRGLVEYNLFVRCRGENELISNKSGGNTYRYNTFLDSPGAQLTLRHGNECVVYGNYFRNTDGLRVFGDRHHIFRNYFEGNSLGITLGNGGAEVADGAPLTSHDRPDNCTIDFNTLVNNDIHYRMTPRQPKALGATNTIFSHNILQGGRVGAKMEGPNSGAVWRENLLWEVGEPGDFPADGYTVANPHLVRGEDGIYRSKAESPVRPDVSVHAHPAAKNNGGEPVTIRLLTIADVGPAAK